MGKGKNVPRLRFPGFTDEWERRKFGDVFKEYSEKNHEELPPLTIIQGTGTIRRDESERNLQYDKSNLKGYKLVNAGDFIVHLRSFEGGLEKANTDGIVSPAYHMFHGDNTDTRFWYPYFRSYEFINVKLKPHVYGIRDGRSIDIEGMKSIDIMVPSYDEQKRTGCFIESLDNLITLHQHRFPGFTGDWEQRKLGELAEIKDSARIPNTEWSEYGVPYIRASDITNENTNGVLFISLERYEYYKARTGAPAQGDVLFNGGGEIGKALLNDDIRPIYVQGGAVLYVRTSISDSLDGQYLKTYFETSQAKGYIDVASAGGTMKHFTLKPSLEMPIQFPNKAEQLQIGSFFKAIDNLITLHQRKLDQMKQYKQGLLQQMFV